MSDVWTEKYRPTVFQDVVGNPHVVDMLRAVADGQAHFPHFIFSGPPGCGKTTLAHVLARAHLGDRYDHACREYNASCDRNEGLIREQVVPFIQDQRGLPEDLLKVIILDEGDCMSPKAQDCLRRAMEIYSRTCRVVLTCNDSSEVLEALQSRCQIMRFAPIPLDALAMRLRQVLQLEDANYDESGIQALVQTAKGDVRNVLNGAQSTASAYGEDGGVSAENVDKITDQPPARAVTRSFQAILRGDWSTAIEPVLFVLRQGYDATDIVRSFATSAIAMGTVPEDVRLEWLKTIRRTRIRIDGGGNGLLQLDAMVCSMIQTLADRSVLHKSAADAG